MGAQGPPSPPGLLKAPPTSGSVAWSSETEGALLRHPRPRRRGKLILRGRGMRWAPCRILGNLSLEEPPAASLFTSPTSLRGFGDRAVGVSGQVLPRAQPADFSAECRRRVHRPRRSQDPRRGPSLYSARQGPT